jgi:hypothetical protein
LTYPTELLKLRRIPSLRILQKFVGRKRYNNEQPESESESEQESAEQPESESEQESAEQPESESEQESAEQPESEQESAEPEQQPINYSLRVPRATQTRGSCHTYYLSCFFFQFMIYC